MLTPVSTLEQLEEEISRLSPQEQLKLVSRVAHRLSAYALVEPTPMSEEELRRQREKEADELIAMCDAVAAMTLGDFDSAEEIRQMRRERDEQIWPSR
jgi:hypothetical protein